jgi:hypothetical protein
VKVRNNQIGLQFVGDLQQFKTIVRRSDDFHLTLSF